MDELLNRLEKQLFLLLDQQKQLAQSNQQLHQGKHALIAREKMILLKQQNAVSQIKMLLSKLKDIEKTL